MGLKMQLYTIEDLENFSPKKIKEILLERSKLCTTLIKNALIGKTIESEIEKDNDSLVFPIKDITYHMKKEIFIDNKFMVIPINISLEGYCSKNKKDNLYEDLSIDHEIDELLEEYVCPKTKVHWGNKKLQGIDYINMDLLIPNTLVNPDIIIFNEYNSFIESTKKLTPLKIQKKKKELEEKLAKDLEQLKYQKFNVIQETHLYIPEDKDELMEFIEYANKNTYDKQALIGVMKKHSDNEEIVSAVLEGFNEEVFEYASKRLKNDRKFIESCLDKSIVNIMHFVADKFKDDRDLILKAIRVNSSVMEIASERLKNDKNLCLVAVGNFGTGGDAYFHISEELKKDKDIILKLIETRGDFFAFCPEVETNKDLLIKAFSTAFDRQSHNLLVNTSEELKNDKEVALAAIKCYPENIYYIGEKLRKEIGDFEPYTYLSKIDMYNEINESVTTENNGTKRKLKM